jgi:hypothetical protein
MSLYESEPTHVIYDTESAAPMAFALSEQHAEKVLTTCRKEFPADGYYSGSYEACPVDSFSEIERREILSGDLEEVCRETWEEMLYVLPPEHWTTRADVETFCMSEHKRGPYTAQYARTRVNGVDRFFTRVVDATDPETWITRDEILSHI